MSLFGDDEPAATGAAYRVLARKYRPTNFDDLVGQDVLVRTLSNAIKTGRLAHAFLLTGIRGVGKTTTARIIARSLNCIGPDGTGGPTISPCGVCPNCVMIAEDRHMDVMEMDAASRTGVGDIRELIDTVHYAPTNARYKIYIIDEVHMLSNNAFNALLKTLEEPPPHVKFIFATTELRKIPVTILSRCQTFDLKRVDGEVLSAHLARIAAKEGVEAEDAALKLIAGAAEGSVRDSLSLLDQGIAHGTGEDGKSRITADIVRDMLGMADRSRSFELLDQVFSGQVETALATFEAQYNDGAEPAYQLQELMELVHLTTRIKLVPDLANSAELVEREREYARTIASKLTVGLLTRAWQVLSKGLQEARHAPNPYMAAEMVLIRLMHASTLPGPGELARIAQEGGNIVASGGGHVPSGGGGVKAPVASNGGNFQSMAPVRSQPMPAQETAPTLALRNFEDLVELFREKREAVLWSHLYQNVRPVSFEAGRLEVNTSSHVPSDFAGKVGHFLREWTGQRWVVAITAAQGQPTLKERAEATKRGRLDEAKQHPLVQAVTARFAGAQVIDFIQPEKVKLEAVKPDAGNEEVEEE